MIGAVLIASLFIGLLLIGSILLGPYYMDTFLTWTSFAVFVGICAEMLKDAPSSLLEAIPLV